MSSNTPKASELEPGVVIIGGGKAGTETAFTLRRLGYDRRLTLIGDENETPYERPPLSKAFLLGKIEPGQFGIRKRELFDRNDVQLLLGAAVTKIDRARSSVHMDDGTVLPYRHLVIATGAAPQLPSIRGGNLPGIHVLRQLEDARSLRDKLQADRHLVICGGGFLGLEVAAAARQRGVIVTVLEQAPTLLSRSSAPEISARLAAIHRSAGVTIETGVGLREIIVAGDGYRVILADDRTIDADDVLLATGAAPRIRLAQDAGLPCRRGILVDEDGRTADRAIFAAGDVAEIPDPRQSNTTLILESIHAATVQAGLVANSVLGLPRSDRIEPPWFWSDQYSHKFQSVGLPVSGALSECLVTAEPPSIATYQRTEGRLVSASFLDAPAAFLRAKRDFMT